MTIKEFDDYILVEGLEDFDVKQTLECGQVFRFKYRDFGYTVYSLCHKADVYVQKDTIIVCDNANYFVNYFDFSTDYAKIKSAFKSL